MGRRLSVIMGLCLLVVVPWFDASAQGERPWAFSIGVLESFDDNRDGTSGDKETMLETRVFPRADLKLYRDRFDLDFYYSPQFCYKSNPRETPGWEQKSTDLYHDLGLTVVHRWSERLSFNASESFNLSDVPADQNTSRTFHEFVTYWVNRVNLAASYEILPKRSAVVVRGSHMMKSYRDDAYAAIGDEEDLGGGVSARYMLRSGWTVVGDVTYDTIDLGDSNAALSRSADVLFVGGALEKIFGLWSARVRLGVDRSSFDVSGSLGGGGYFEWTGTSTKPGADIEVACSTESGMTRASLAAGHHTLRSDIVPFATQQRTSVELKASHSFTERITLAMNGIYGKGEYSSPSLAGGSDEVTGVGAVLTYVWNRNLSLEAAYRFEDWNADENIRESYQRNVGELALKARF